MADAAQFDHVSVITPAASVSNPMSAQDTRSPADLAPGEIRPHRALTAADERYCERSVPAAFAAQAARTPSAPALATDAGSMTYEELDHVSNRIAAGILAELGAAGERVGILLRDDAGFVAALLGVMKAGGP